MRIFGVTLASIAGAAALCVGAAAVADPGAPLAAGLDHLVTAWEGNDPRFAAHLAQHITSVAGDPLVMVRLADGAAADEVLPKLSAAGFRLVTRSSINRSLVEGYMPIGAARSLAAVAGVRSVHAVQRPVTHAGAVQSQAVALQKADVAQALGFDGTGIKLGVISDSYDACTGCLTNAADDIASGDLPAAGVTVLEEEPVDAQPPPTDEGRAMLQLVHDIAPGAQLGFATAAIGELDFAENIIALRNKFGADIVVDDSTYFDEPMFSDGILAQAVNIVAQSGGAYFSSAGNNGLEAYESDYRPVSFADARRLVAAGRSNLHLEQIPAAIRPKSVHDFAGADGERNIAQRFASGAANTISFQWDEPFFVGKVKTDYNIYVFDQDGNWQDPSSPAFPGFYTTDDNTQTDAAFEFLFLPPFPTEVHGGHNLTYYQIVIGKMNNGPARHIKYINVNGLGVSARQGASSTFGHAVASGGQAVAATYYAIPSFPEDFSSPGPSTIYFDALGNRLAAPEIRRVPQLTAADGVDTTFFGFDADGNGLLNFFGTSAAAPDAAASAALVLEAAGGPRSLSPARLYRRLQETATPMHLAEERGFAAADAGPVRLVLKGDWTREGRYFRVSVDGDTRHSVAAMAIDTTRPGLLWSTNPNRFWIGESNGPALTDVTESVSADGSTLLLAFAPGTVVGDTRFTFGMSAFALVQGSTQEDPDRFRGATVTVTLDDGSVRRGTIVAAPVVRDAFNNFTGYGLVNTAKAIEFHDR